VEDVGDVVVVVVGGGEDEPGMSALNEDTVAVPPWVRNRIPQYPEVRLVSVTVAIHPPGSVPDDDQTLAESVDPWTLK
jgi:hypothetical protein